MRSRLLETFWAGRAAWLLARTSGRWRHRDLHARLRGAAIDLGAELVAVRHGAPPERARELMDRLAWLGAVAVDCGALAETDVHTLRGALATLDAFL